MKTLLFPLKAARRVVTMVDSMPAAFEETFIYRRLICAHVRYLMVAVRLPQGELYAATPVCVNGAALWYDEENEEIRELHRGKGVLTAPAPDEEDQIRLETICALTYGAWKGRLWDETDEPQIAMDELLSRSDDPRVKRYLRTKVKAPLWIRNVRCPLKLYDDDDHGSFFNVGAIALYVSLLRDMGLRVRRARWRVVRVENADASRALLLHAVVGSRLGDFHTYLALASTDR